MKSKASNLWWQKPLRTIQMNLQVKDTALINPEKLADQVKEMGGNSLVFNVGGIYAWYRSEVAYHHVNEFLPEYDLLARVIEACHERDIKFIARFDFFMADDRIYLERPQWFARNPQKEPVSLGSKRTGQWSQLMLTCVNGAYRNEAVAMPVLDEVISKYNIDGIFLNAPLYVPCNCEVCQIKYRQTYNKELPTNPADHEESWESLCVTDHMENIYSLIKQKNKDLPLILYYIPKTVTGIAGSLLGYVTHENLLERERTADMLCTEYQNALSKGHKNIMENWYPAVSIKLARSLPHKPAPYGIVHSSPGMDWRHTGLPSAEYLFWLSQVPAHGGNILHSLTGIPDTILDKRILKTISAVNHMVAKVEDMLEEAESASQVVLMWNSDQPGEGWADGLLNNQVPFDVLLKEQATVDRLKGFKVVVIPDKFAFTESFVQHLSEYVRQGGNVIVEGSVPGEFSELYDLLGINRDVITSEALAASYLRFEGSENPLQRNLEETELIAHRGSVAYCSTRDGATVLATLVPPFSPLDGVGTPPERASIPVTHTNLPLCIVNSYGQGKAIYLTFSLSRLITEFRMEDHYKLMKNTIDFLLGEDKFIEVSSYQGLQLAVFRKHDKILVNLVNGVGHRPLSVNVPLHQINIAVRLKPEETVQGVRLLQSEQKLEFTQTGRDLTITLPELKVWEALLIELEQ
ncbi:family 10 glycosylhydrolase [Neobacillus sp. NRS-1170]|uniref:family 10 glycosylhydrolase n=1 Tax=Neobacillus sp. NRS-1170 TaxID=3233898 RepID=UPI003D28BAD1